MSARNMMRGQMINKQLLWKNWELRETPYDCMAEIRLYDPNRGWEVYLIALNPEDDEDCIVLVHTEGIGWECVETAFWGFETLVMNTETTLVDPEWRPRLVRELMKVLKKRGKK